MAKTYNDYPKAASNNAKRALKYKDENPDNKCGTPVGWARANQLAKREKISRETIARMASFKRHQKSKDVPYSEGCGGLMWDAWGGSSGVNWAISKLKQIDKEKESMARKFAFGVESNGETQVNKEAGTMTSVAMISAGPALGHGLFVDKKSLETIEDELDGTKLPAYITHRGAIFDDRLTREIGFFENFRIEGDRLLGDFQAFESFQEDDNRKYNRLFELAEKMPERFGLSIVFAANAVWATETGDVSSDEAPEDALFEYPSIRVEEVSSADFVDSPAANERGLFSQIDTKPTHKMTKAELVKLNEELQEQNKALALSVTESEAQLEEMKISLAEKKKEELEEEETPEVEETPEAEEAPEAEVVEDSEEEVVEDSEEEVVEDSEEEDLRDSKTLPDARPMEEEIEELKKEIAELKANLEEKDGELEEKVAKEEEMETKSSELSSKVTTLEKLIEGSELVEASKGDEVYEPSKASRSKVISEFAKENNISEFAATLRLGKDRPELFKI